MAGLGLEPETTLPSFFQFQGQSISDGLLEFEELGGESEDDFPIDEQEEENLDVDNFDHGLSLQELTASSLPGHLKIPQNSLLEIIHPSGKQQMKTAKPKPNV